MEKLFAKIDAEPVRKPKASFNLGAWLTDFVAGFSPRTLAYGATAAALAIVLQAGILAGVFVKERAVGPQLASYDAERDRRRRLCPDPVQSAGDAPPTSRKFLDEQQGLHRRRSGRRQRPVPAARLRQGDVAGRAWRHRQEDAAQSGGRLHGAGRAVAAQDAANPAPRPDPRPGDRAPASECSCHALAMRRARHRRRLVASLYGRCDSSIAAGSRSRDRCRAAASAAASSAAAVSSSRHVGRAARPDDRATRSARPAAIDAAAFQKFNTMSTVPSAIGRPGNGGMRQRQARRHRLSPPVTATAASRPGRRPPRRRPGMGPVGPDRRHRRGDRHGRSPPSAGPSLPAGRRRLGRRPGAERAPASTSRRRTSSRFVKDEVVLEFAGDFAPQRLRRSLARHRLAPLDRAYLRAAPTRPSSARRSPTAAGARRCSQPSSRVTRRRCALTPAELPLHRAPAGASSATFAPPPPRRRAPRRSRRRPAPGPRPAIRRNTRWPSCG